MKKYTVYIMVLVAIIHSTNSMDPIPTVFLTKDIIDHQVKHRLTLQEMSRLKRSCKIYSGIVDTEMPFAIPSASSFCSFSHLFFRCHYDIRTKVLTHYAATKNATMFGFLWNQEKHLREIDCLRNLYGGKFISIEEMELYKKQFSSKKNIEKIRVQQVVRATHYRPNNSFCLFLKRILPHTGFNIFDVSYCKALKKRANNSPHYLKNIIKSVCTFRDPDLLVAILGGCIEPRALKYVFHYSEKLFIEALREKNAFIEGVPDQDGRSFDYYYCWHLPPSERYLYFSRRR